MKIDDVLMSKLEKLSKLKLSDSEKEKLSIDLSNMLGMVEKMNALDTKGVAPLVYMSEGENVFREDEVRNEVSNEAALKNAPLVEKPYFRVPKVIDLKK